MTVKIRRGTHKDIQFGHRLIDIEVGLGLPSVDELWEEIRGYMDVILGRKDAPMVSPYLGLAEASTAYYCRAQEIDALIHAAEREGAVMRGSALYRFRTGELRSFIELAKRASELGSRRLTQEQLLHDQRFED
jgi:hypothetical protein